MNDKFNRAKEIIATSKNIVFFGGAGVSTESGIPDFRSSQGLYNTQNQQGFSPEEMLSYSFFKNHTKMFYDFYKANMIFPDAKPNKAHKVLAYLEKKGALKAIITQNIDGLHQKAGSKNVYELHGTVLENVCVRCGKKYDLNFIIKSDGIPFCNCGGTVKPNVVLYEEQLDSDTIEKAIRAIASAEVLIVAGTSLKVYPAAGFINYYTGDKLIFINKTKTDMDYKADISIIGSVGEILGDMFSDVPDIE